MASYPAVCGSNKMIDPHGFHHALRHWLTLKSNWLILELSNIYQFFNTFVSSPQFLVLFLYGGLQFQILLFYGRFELFPRVLPLLGISKLQFAEAVEIYGENQKVIVTSQSIAFFIPCVKS